MLWDLSLDFSIALKYDLSSSAADMHVKFQSDTIIITSNIAALRLHKIWRQDALSLNTLRPRQNGRHFPDDTFKRIFLNENARISIKISLKFVPINKIPAMV